MKERWAKKKARSEEGTINVLVGDSHKLGQMCT